MRPITKIVVHCSDTSADFDIGAEEIRRWHVVDNGWSDIGYHYVIRRNGTVEEGRPVETPGAHVRYHNHDSIGVCLVGGHQGVFNYTFDQIASLHSLLEQLSGRFKGAVVVGHRDLDSKKACPGFDVASL